jgi:hypothetical protein
VQSIFAPLDKEVKFSFDDNAVVFEIRFTGQQ